MARAEPPGPHPWLLRACIALPLLMLAANVLAWLRWGTDLPYFDDWRAYDGGLNAARYAAREAGAFSPSASVEYRFPDGTRLQLSLAAATRFPTVGELFQGSLNGDGTFNPNSFDPNLRPEGEQGPLVRTLPSMMSYYERWAKAWEFQALI